MTDVLVEHDVSAAMQDGTVLRADVYRPVGEGRWPVLLVRLPYGKQMPAMFALLDPLPAARRGFVVVVHDAVWPSRIVLPVVPAAATDAP